MNKCKINQLTLEGEYVQTFESTKAAAKSVNGEGAAISHAAMKGTQYRGFIWQYAEPKPIRRPKIEILEEMNLALIEDLENRIHKLPKYIITLKIRQIMLNNDTINELMQEQEQPNTIKQKGRPSISVKQYNKNGQYIKTFNSIKDASEETREGPDKIRAVINGKTPLTPRGWYYKRVETQTKQTTNESDETIDENFFYMPKDKENRKKMLKNYIESRLGTYMMHLTKHQQILERKFLQTLIKSL